jgi:DNA-binding NtrC family response regulator
LSGVELLKKIHDAHMALPVIMITDILPKLEFAEHPWIQPATMLVEPYSSAELLGMVKKALSTNKEKFRERQIHKKTTRIEQSRRLR